MNKELQVVNNSKHKNKVLFVRRINDGMQAVFRFPNGYGASVVQGPHSYGGTVGLFELGVVEFNGKGKEDFNLTYDTPVTDDVEGHLTANDVECFLDRIEELNPRK